MHLAEHVGYTFATSKESNRRQPIFETAGAPQLGSGRPDQILIYGQLNKINTDFAGLV